MSWSFWQRPQQKRVLAGRQLLLLGLYVVDSSQQPEPSRRNPEFKSGRSMVLVDLLVLLLGSDGLLL